jgi:transposase InsO family protein
MKDVFLRHGIPEEVYSDNGPQYKSYVFKQFAKKWNFKHTTSSPRYPQSNGLAESSVKIIKNMIKKCITHNDDITAGLLAIRNTPLQCGSSPAQLLMGRQLQEQLPTFHMQNDNSSKRDLQTERQKQKKQYDKQIRTTKEHTSYLFRKGQHVRLRNPTTCEWSLKGTIVDRIAPRSYTIKLAEGGNVIRRNTQHIRRIYSLTVDKETIEKNIAQSNDTIPNAEEDVDDEIQQVSENNQKKQSRYGRVYKTITPIDYEDL